MRGASCSNVHCKQAGKDIELSIKRSGSRFLKRLVLSTVLRGETDIRQMALDLCDFSILCKQLSVETMVSWSTKHRVCTYESFVKDNEFITTFRRHFNLQIGLFPLVRTFRYFKALPTRGILLNKKSAQTAHSPENVEGVWQLARSSSIC